jgi:hypothetical protein
MALFDICRTVEKTSIKQLSQLFINNLLYGSLNLRNNSHKTIKDEYHSTFEPFLPPIRSHFQYTLVLDLDETLIHFFYVRFIN